MEGCVTTRPAVAALRPQPSEAAIDAAFDAHLREWKKVPRPDEMRQSDAEVRALMRKPIQVALMAAYAIDWAALEAPPEINCEVLVACDGKKYRINGGHLFLFDGSPCVLCGPRGEAPPEPRNLHIGILAEQVIHAARALIAECDHDTPPSLGALEKLALALRACQEAEDTIRDLELGVRAGPLPPEPTDSQIVEVVCEAYNAGLFDGDPAAVKVVREWLAARVRGVVP